MSVGTSIFAIFFRILSGLTGIAVLALLTNYIFVEGKDIPLGGGGYYGPIAVPMGIFFAVAFIGYAVGGQRLLRKIAPGLAEKKFEATEDNGKTNGHED